jgi:predicted RecB family nuclease
MQQVDGQLFFSPSDLNHFVECEHLTSLDLLALDGELIPREKDPQAEIIRTKGFEHERAWVERLRSEGKQIVEIATGPEPDWPGAAARTVDAMRAGAEVIYQGVFVDAPWRGIADFLIRIDTPSALGSWSYEAADAKLARHPRPKFVLQLCWYSEQLWRIQGVAPAHMHVVLGSGQTDSYRPSEFYAYYRSVRHRFLRALNQARGTPGLATYPSPVGHCGVCGYSSHCEQRRTDDDHLSLVAGIRRDQVERLNAIGVATVVDLSRLDLSTPTGIMPTTLDRLTRQARLQVRARGAEHQYELLTPEPKRGFGLLPKPSDGDVFFDIEGYPYFEPTDGLEYLWGLDYDRTFSTFEATDRAAEKRAFEDFIDFVHARLQVYPDLHVYHYAAYETSAITRLMGQYASREAEVDDLLRRGVFVDLYQVVRQSIQISYDSYSLKRVREFFMPDAGRGLVTGGGESILEFQRYLETRDAAILAAIRDYNHEDCESTRLLRDWLLERKREAERSFGLQIDWYVKASGAEKAPEERDTTRDLRERLARLATAADVAPDLSTCAALLEHLLEYHRREAKPGWWAFFERLKKSLDELREDTEAIAYLSPVGEPVTEKKSTVHTLAFPEQEFKLKEGVAVCEPVEGKKTGDILSIDAAGTLTLKRGPSLASVSIPSALIADGPLDAKAQRESLARIAEAVVTKTGSTPVGCALLTRACPSIAGVAPGESIQTMDLARQQALVAGLQDSYLFVQGPPGSGKTYTGARLIASLVRDGKRVGITATSHKAIHNLLDEVVVAGQESAIAIAGLKKCSDVQETIYSGDGFDNTTNNAECAATDLPIVAGTSWLFARDEMAGKFDYLFIDEAGQVSLADAVAMSPCARNIVLLGDPQQLPNVTQGIHPGGVGVSVLDHLLQGEPTVAPERGLFLEETWRMHPDVCSFISELAYDGRLRSEPGCAQQRIDSTGLSGTGLRFLAVDHTGNAQQSQEEAELIAAEVRTLLATGTFTERSGAAWRPALAGPFARRLTPADILVVAPYNMQVRALLNVLPAGVEAGTVDKFQGRQAPVVFFSMATSSGEDIPRGLDFLFSRNRLNVAISRAKALAVLVCSPRLLDTKCRTVEQMRLVNGLCAFVEHAKASLAVTA